MKTTMFVILILFVLMSFASAATPSLWAFDVGFLWGGDETSYRINVEPFTSNNAAYPSGSIQTLGDGAYVPSNSSLYVSGGNPDGGEPWYYQNTIAVYTGSPGGLELVSSSNANMDGYYAIRGIEHFGGSLYAVGFTGFLDEDNVLLRIDNPGTASQTATQVGPGLGETEHMGIPQALCGDGQGNLLAIFGSSLYRVDIQTGDAALLRAYSEEDLGLQPFLEGLTLSENRLFGVTTPGNVFEIDTDTYGATKLGELDGNVWTGLVTVPEPSIFLIMGAGFLGLFFARRRA